MIMISTILGALSDIEWWYVGNRPHDNSVQYGVSSKKQLFWSGKKPGPINSERRKHYRIQNDGGWWVWMSILYLILYFEVLLISIILDS